MRFNTMSNYNSKDVELVFQYKKSGMSDNTIIALLNKSSEHKYHTSDIVKMIDQYQRTHVSQNGKLFDIAAGVVFNPSKRRRIKLTLFAVLMLFIVSMVVLGLTVSWKPVIWIFGSVLGIAAITVLAFIISLKTGMIEKFIDKHT